jgi:hypothetical protein
VFENGDFWLAISIILGRNKNNMVTDLTTKEPAEVWECTFFFPPEIHKLTMLCVRACCLDEA